MSSSAALSDAVSNIREKRSVRRIDYLQASSRGWTDLDKTSDAMSKRKKRPATQEIQDVFNNKVNKFYYDNRYKEAFKEATLVVARNREDPSKQGQRGSGIRAVVQRVNNEKLISPNDKKLTRGAVFNAVDRGDIGVSPLKKGKKETVTPLVTLALAT